jgi:hypothetical protein
MLLLCITSNRACRLLCCCRSTVVLAAAAADSDVPKDPRRSRESVIVMCSDVQASI